MEKSISNPPKFRDRAAFMALALFTAVFILVVYTFLHEAGHVLAGLVYGQSLTAFSIRFWDLSAHAGLAGDLTAGQRAIQSAAGVGFPLLVWLTFLVITPRKTNFHLRLVKLLTTSGVLGSLLAWMILPFFRLFGNAFPRDDVTHFLQASEMPPLLLAALAAGIFTLGWVFYSHRVGKASEQLRGLREADRPAWMAGTYITVPVMAAILTICLSIAFATRGMADANAAALSAPPASYREIAQIDLTSQAYKEEVLAEFSLKKAEPVGVWFQVTGVDTDYFDLRLEGSEGTSLVLTHGEGWQAERASGLRQETLPAGDYQVRFTASQSRGTLRVYLGHPNMLTQESEP